MELSTSIPMFSQLPRIYLITPEPSDADELSDFMAHLEKALISGIRLVQLRAKKLAPKIYELLAQQALVCCHRYQALLLLNSSPQKAIELNSDGVHLDSARLMSCQNRPLGTNKLVSAACHNEAQLKKAESIGVDLITLSPVLHTQSHPEAKPLGWDNFAKLTSFTNRQVYALGGMKRENLTTAQEHGAYGIAAISALWNERE